MIEASGNIVAAILDRAAVAGDKPFLLEGDAAAISFADIDARTGQLGARLGLLGGKVGDRVLVQVEKSPEAVLLYLATLRMGMVFVPLNTAYTAEEVAYFIGDAEPAIIVCRPTDAATMQALSGTVKVVTLDKRGGGSLLDTLPIEPAPLVARASDDLACILYTSGTTGRSKGAMLTHGNLLSNAQALVSLWQWRPDDVLIHILPIYHVHGLFVALHCALLAPATVLFHRAFDPAAVIADMARATVLMGVPTHYTRLNSIPDLTRAACAHMRLFISGSAPLLAADHAAFAEKSGHQILERYGMTETGMITSNPYEGDRIAGTVGFPLPGVEVSINDDSGAPVARDAPGVLQVRGPNVFAGYWRNPEKTAEEFREGGYFVTGDIATMDGEGRVTLVGRAKDLIIAGGLNIYPKEIETAIDELDGVVESAVIGVPHPDLGEGVVVVVAARPGARLTEKSILEALGDRLARFKQPRRAFIVADLPRNAMGKVQKAALRAAYSTTFDEGAAA
jgi:malonyl-CoA/methylmalonyl-CoA synthetase